MSIVSTSLTVPEQSSPRFRVAAWLPFRNREMGYSEDIYVSYQGFSTICKAITISAATNLFST